MITGVLVIVFGLWLLSYPLADFLLHHVQGGAFHASEASRQVALTFDDGPDASTPEMLAVLRQAGVKATFFMIVERAQAHPHWVKMVAEEGHEIGLHGVRHRSSYLMTPRATMASIRRGVAELKALSGQEILWYRPPWGHHSLWTWWACRRLGLKRLLWTVAPNDFRAENSPKQIASYVFQALSAGGVVVLHDGGGDRSRTVSALPLIVQNVRRMALEPVTASQLVGERSWLKVAWRWWETRFQLAWKVEPIPSRVGSMPIFRIGRIRYHGPRIPSPAGTLEPGAWFGEIHFDNGILSRYSTEPSHMLKAYQLIRRSLSDLATFVSENERYRAVTSFGGITVLDAGQATERLGFRRTPVRGWRKVSMRIYLILLMAMYHRRGWRTLRGRWTQLHPVFLTIDRRTLIERYGRDPIASEVRVQAVNHDPR